MNYFDVTIYGIVQGLTEFFPISSSAHLALLPKVLGISDPGAYFDLVMHLGTALAVMVYYHKRILLILKHLPSALLLRKKITDKNQEKRANIFYVRNILVTLVATAIAFIPIYPLAKTYGRGPTFIFANLIIFGLLMYWSDRQGVKNSKGLKSSKESDPSTDSYRFNESLNIKDSLIIGVGQALALFPGVSRSGVTITCGRFLGYSREEISHFTFLLSLPIILAGSLLKIPELLSENSGVTASCLLLGIFVSFIVGILAIHSFIKSIKKFGLGIFALYRFVVAYFIWYFLLR